MSHLNLDILDFILLTIYPVIGLLIIEIISRIIKLRNKIKLLIQAIILTIFGLSYIFLIESHWITAFVLFSLSFVLLYQSKNSN